MRIANSELRSEVQRLLRQSLSKEPNNNSSNSDSNVRARAVEFVMSMLSLLFVAAANSNRQAKASLGSVRFCFSVYMSRVELVNGKLKVTQLVGSALLLAHGLIGASCLSHCVETSERISKQTSEASFSFCFAHLVLLKEPR